MREKIKIHTEFIKLDNFVKFSGISTTGGEAKNLILNGEIKVNNDVCKMRNKKIKDKDIVSYKDKEFEVEFFDNK